MQQWKFHGCGKTCEGRPECEANASAFVKKMKALPVFSGNRSVTCMGVDRLGLQDQSVYIDSRVEGKEGPTLLSMLYN